MLLFVLHATDLQSPLENKQLKDFLETENGKDVFPSLHVIVILLFLLAYVPASSVLVGATRSQCCIALGTVLSLIEVS